LPLPQFIYGLHFFIFMHTTVYFYNQLFMVAIEVKNIMSIGMLPAKFISKRLCA